MTTETPEWLDDDVIKEDESTIAAREPSLGYLSELCKERAELEAEIADLNEQIAKKADRIMKIDRDLIPTLMEELGIQSFKLSDGSELNVANVINANITEANKGAALEWLAKYEFDGIVKTNVAASFGKGENSEAVKAATALREAGFDAVINQSVHPMTLKSFVKERLDAERSGEESIEEGKHLPVDVFGVFEYKTAKVKAPPAPRKKRK